MNNENKFQTEVELDIDYDSATPDGFEYESRSSSAEISYSVYLECRSWGIKNMGYIMHDQEICFNLDLVKKEEEDSESYSFKVKISKMTVDTDYVNFNQGDVCPSKLIIELTNIQRDGNIFTADGTGSLEF